MFVTRLPSVLLGSLLLIASLTEPSTSAETQDLSERKRALEVYVEQLDEMLEKQAQELIEISSSEEAGKIQAEEENWKRERDLDCSQKGSSETARIRELECRADFAEIHFEHREIQIDRIRGRFRRLDPYVLKPPESISELPGAYYRGDGLGYNISLDLNQDQSYLAIWSGCLGEYGRSAGTWSLEQGVVRLSPIEESDSMKKQFNELHVGYQNGALFLFPSPNNDSFKEYGPSRSSVFSHRDRRSAD